MFDFGWDEMALIAVVSLIVIGPKDLPVVLRQMGRLSRKARQLAAEFQRGVDDMVREAELKDLRQQVEKATDSSALRRNIEAAIDPDGEITKAMEPPRPSATGSAMSAFEVPDDAPALPEPKPAPLPATPDHPPQP